MTKAEYDSHHARVRAELARCDPDDRTLALLAIIADALLEIARALPGGWETA